ncbi:putative bifunctional diguanylate cyclase/phosphodiesterase [Cohnella faecalis]|uniref:putative bifunctional diguanylate cyclase/phosphodiesterase n=1 Tax=Cohnella faecalis TaxID=2315694 RepID=UPI001F388ED9|nr:GGDEF domain-containing phosphodiesterase [Cohnella faecalis]
MDEWSDIGLWSAITGSAVLLASIAAYAGWAAGRKRARPSADAPSYHSELLQSLYEDSPVSFAVIDRQGRFLDVNHEPSVLTGYTFSELSGQPFASLVADESYDATLQMFHKTLQGERCTQDIRIIHKDGSPIDLNISTSPLVRKGRTIGILSFVHDDSDRKRTLERIRYMAYYDDMTGLPNRRSFMKRLEDRLAETKASGDIVTVCFLDVDGFKLVNASFGRDFGDMLLLQIAERLTHCFDSPRDLARMEGDEFVGMLVGSREGDGLERLGNSILRAMEEPFELNGLPLHITASIGMAVGDPDDDMSSLMKKADAAMNRVKENGKNDYLLYDSEMGPTALHKLTLQHEMRKALNNGEFLLYYQPKYDLGSGKVVGLEALVRWRHPVRGLVPPGEFIPAAEESGLIVPLGDWVLEEACRQNKAWHDEGMPRIPVSVNLSIRQFAQRDLTGKVADILKNTGLSPQYLELEVTESMTMDVERATRCLVELTNLGVNISVDDFGTGYSSFSYLKNLPISRLKIDRSFVRDIQQDPDDAAIVAAIIAMAHNLQLQVIAEGVETEEQVHFLRRHHCDEMQGYFGSPPLPVGDIRKMLNSAQQSPAAYNSLPMMEHWKETQ